MEKVNKKKQTIYQIAITIIATVMLCLLGKVSVDIAGSTLVFAFFVIYIASFVGGSWVAVVASVVYVILGIAGLPIFKDGNSGMDYIIGAYGFFDIALILMAFICAEYVRNSRANVIKVLIAFIVATAVYYMFGGIWYIWVEKSDMNAAIELFVKPYIVMNAVQIVVSVIIGKILRTLLVKAGLITELPKPEKKTKAVVAEVVEEVAAEETAEEKKED